MAVSGDKTGCDKLAVNVEYFYSLSRGRSVSRRNFYNATVAIYHHVTEKWVLIRLGRDEKRIFDQKFIDRKSTRLNSSHQIISYAVFCLKKKKKQKKAASMQIVIKSPLDT